MHRPRIALNASVALEGFRHLEAFNEFCDNGGKPEIIVFPSIDKEETIVFVIRNPESE